MPKQMILRQDEDKTYLIETDFSSEEIKDTLAALDEEIRDAAEEAGEDGYSDEIDEKILRALQDKGYIKILGPGLEIIDIDAYFN